MNARALAGLQTWAKEFPKRKCDHFVFPSEKVGIAGNDEIVSVFDTDPSKAITSWKVSWTTARTAAGISCRFHDLRHTAVTRLLESGQPFAVVAEIMGWSPATSVRMAKRYGHIGDSETPSDDSVGDEEAHDKHRDDRQRASAAARDDSVRGDYGSRYNDRRTDNERNR